MIADHNDALAEMTVRPTRSATAIPGPAELSVIVPTFNERANISLLVDRLRVALDEIAW